MNTSVPSGFSNRAHSLRWARSGTQLGTEIRVCAVIGPAGSGLAVRSARAIATDPYVLFGARSPVLCTIWGDQSVAVIRAEVASRTASGPCRARSINRLPGANVASASATFAAHVANQIVVAARAVVVCRDAVKYSWVSRNCGVGPMTLPLHHELFQPAIGESICQRYHTTDNRVLMAATRKNHGMVPDLESDPFGERIRRGAASPCNYLVGGSGSEHATRAAARRFRPYAGLPRHKLSATAPELRIQLLLTPPRRRMAGSPLSVRPAFRPPPFRMLSGAGLLGGAARSSSFVVCLRGSVRRSSWCLEMLKHSTAGELVEFAVLPSPRASTTGVAAACVGKKPRNSPHGPSGAESQPSLCCACWAASTFFRRTAYS